MSLGPICDCLMRGVERCEIHGVFSLEQRMSNQPMTNYTPAQADQVVRSMKVVHAKIAALEAELEQWRTWGVVEIAVRNASVAEYMEHWEGRATKAEAQVALLSAPVSDEEVVRSKALFGVEPYPLNSSIIDACGLLDVIKSEWGEAWSEHDQKVRASLSIIASRTAPAKEPA